MSLSETAPLIVFGSKLSRTVNGLLYWNLDQTITYGSVGLDVKLVQYLLKKSGAASGLKVDGVWGPSMQGAVHAYKLKNKLMTDGRVSRGPYRGAPIVKYTIKLLNAEWVINTKKLPFPSSAPPVNLDTFAAFDQATLSLREQADLPADLREDLVEGSRTIPV